MRRWRSGSPIEPASTLTTSPSWLHSSARRTPQLRALVTEASGPILSLWRRDDDVDERAKPCENGRKCKAEWCELCQFDDEQGKCLRRFRRERDWSLSHRRLADIGELNPRRAGLRLKPAVAPGHPCDQGNRAKRRRKKHRHKHPVRPRQFTHDGIMCRVPRTGRRCDSMAGMRDFDLDQCAVAAHLPSERAVPEASSWLRLSGLKSNPMPLWHRRGIQIPARGPSRPRRRKLRARRLDFSRARQTEANESIPDRGCAPRLAADCLEAATIKLLGNRSERAAG